MPDNAIRWLFENSRELMAVVGPDNAFKLVNPAWARATGWRDDQLIGRPAMELVHPDDIAVIAKSAADMRAGLATEHTVRVRHRDGEYCWYAGYNKALENGDLIGVLRDVTDERRREEDLEEARTNSRLLSEAAGIGTWSYDPIEMKNTWSSDFCVMTGWDPEEMETAQQFQALVHPDDLSEFHLAFKEGVRKGVDKMLQHRMKTKDGRWIHIRTHFRAVAHEYGVYAIKGISQNVTPLVEALEAAEAASEAKANFLANMSHEIRTPMNGVLGVLHLLNDEPLTAEGRKLLREAVGCGQMLSELLNDVLDFSKIEAGKLELNPEPVNPGHLVEGVISLIRPQAEAKGLRLTVDRDEAKGWIAADPVRLRQALFNLIGNAVKFTLEGEVKVTARLFETEGGQRLRLEIADTGVGISREAQANLFQRFSQADGSTTRRFGGTGLGLAITQRLAELMGGEVGVKSQLGRGSTFWVEVDAPATEPAATAAITRADCLDGLTILVVEDNATNRMIATKLLENLGASVETAEDGERGVEAAARGGHDLILMDIQMPGIDGMEATRRIREAGGTAAATPVIALTANVMAHQRQDYLNAGMNGVVGKPINPGALLNEIVRIAGQDQQNISSAA